MDSRPSGSGGSRPAARAIGQPFGEESASSTQPLCEQASNRAQNRGLSSDQVDVQMHFLDRIKHATHWLKEHEMQRAKKPLAARLCKIKSGQNLPYLERMSSVRRSATVKQLSSLEENVENDRKGVSIS